MIINLEQIEKLEPCEDRLDNYKSFYGEKSFTIQQFMGLKNINQADKCWVAFRLMNISDVPLAVADIAESVLHIYEKAYPGDNRVKWAIEATRNKRLSSRDYSAAHAAAYTAAYIAAGKMAPYSAAWVACVSASIAMNVAVAMEADSAAQDPKAHRKLIRKILIKYLRKV